jgi:hypothetical protein
MWLDSELGSRTLCALDFRTKRLCCEEVEERETDVEPESTSNSPIIMKTFCLETRKNYFAM